MATGLDITSIPVTFKKLDGGLNSTSGPLGVEDNEGTVVQNIDLDAFGSVLQRGGTPILNSVAAAASGTSQGLYWYTSLFDRNAIMVNHGKIYKMDGLDGTWDDITGAVSISPVDSETKLLLDCDGEDGIVTFTDLSVSGHTITANSDAQVDTAQQKFGTGSLLLDGANDFLSAPDSADWYFSTSDFTIDFWVRFDSITNQQAFIGQDEDANNRWQMFKNSNGNANKLQLEFIDGGVTQAAYEMTQPWQLNTGTWYHLAWVRSTVDALIFIDGVSQSLTTGTAFAANDVGDTTADLEIGIFSGSSSPVDGWMDEIRVSNGVARWTTDFTPSTNAYSDFLPQDFETYLGKVLGTGKENKPWQWTAGNTTATNMTMVPNLTGARFIKQFQNYTLVANVIVEGIRQPSTIYWSSILSISAWNAADNMTISKDDGDEITGFKVLGDRLVVYKENSIYLVLFTGNADVPFVRQKTNSSVGCVAPFSIKEIDNGHIFMSQTGVYFFDGFNSFKISDKINATFDGINKDRLSFAASLFQKKKNQYVLSVASDTSLQNNFQMVWNSNRQAWATYVGISAASLAIFMINGTEERPYYADYLGYSNRMDSGKDDFPAGTRTAINAQFYTNWKAHDNIVDDKTARSIYIAHKSESKTNLTVAYSWDFFNGDEYSSTFSMLATRSVTALTTRRDLTGRGKFVRLGFKNSETTSSFQIDGIGMAVGREGRP